MSLPQNFGRYTLTQRLGVGGMAEVYRATTPRPGDVELEVCLKRILPHCSADPEFVRMFVDEARVASRLRHANIVQILDFDEVDGDYFIAMELVEGKDLRGLLGELHRRGELLGEARAIEISIGLARALAYAHSRHDKGQPLQIVHRDVSPHNLLLSFSGEVKLSDFGIARAASRLTHTATGMVKGKVAYMAPEQAAAGPIDARIDQFAAGLVLHEMLTGVRAYAGDSQNEILQRAARAQVPALPDSVTPSLRAIVSRATALDPQDRFADMATMEQQLLLVRSELQPSPEDLDVGEPLRRLFGEAASARPGTEVLPAIESLPPYQDPPLDPTSSERPRAEQPNPVVEKTAPVATQEVERKQPLASPRRSAPSGLLRGGLLVSAALAVGLIGIWGTGIFAAPDRKIVAGGTGQGVGDPELIAQPTALPAALPVAADASQADPGVRVTDVATPGRLDAGQGSGADATASVSAPRTSSQVGKGRVVIRVRDAWAEVWFGGRKRGLTPLELNLPAGRRTLELVNPEIPVRRKVPVRVKAGKTTRVEVSLRGGK